MFSSMELFLGSASVINLIIFIQLFSYLATSSIARAHAQQPPAQQHPNKLVVLTLTDDLNSESFLRFNRSVETNNLDLTVLTWSERDNRSRELDLYRKALLNYRNNEDLLVLIVDSSGTIINGNQKEIITGFSSLHKKPRILFAADQNCWPDSSLANWYPEVVTGAVETSNSSSSSSSSRSRSRSSSSSRYLNSRTVIGFAPALWDLLNVSSNEIDQSSESSFSSGNPQVFYTKAFLNPDTRNRLQIELDYRAQLLHNLSPDDRVELEFDTPDSVRLKNLAHQTVPLVVYGDQLNKVVLNSLGNYLAKAWTPGAGCRYCDKTIKLPAENPPSVLIGIFIEEPTPFLEDFFQSVAQLEYPRHLIHLFLHSPLSYHERHLKQFLLDIGSSYASQRLLHHFNNGANITEWEARKMALEHCEQLDCGYYLSLDASARLDAPETLKVLIEANKTVIAPLLSRPTKLWSNFWGSLTMDGFYARSHDYVSIVKRDRVGLWNVPLLLDAYLIEGTFIKNKRRAGGSVVQAPEVVSLASMTSKPGLLFSHELRLSGVDQFVLNTHEFGHLVDPTSFNVSLKNPDFYQLQDNMLDWERHYLHENYSLMLDASEKLEQPCQDVFWFPLVSERFCEHLIEIMEHHGQWSGGKNEDPRIEGGYESVPTRDIHLRQVGLHQLWLDFLRDYVMPIQLREYIGYEHDPPRADLAFVVRYHPSEQPSLRPHHDSSTYTLNIALNEPGIDYQGGGCKFVRYNCSVVESRQGWALMHPGRLTHYHEGLPVTNGTRYIMVTFVDP